MAGAQGRQRPSKCATVAPPWELWGREPLNDHDALAADAVMTRLRRFDATLVNEVTIWGRVVFPMLMLAESDGAQAWSQVPLRATVGDVELVGVVDGAIGRPVAGELDLPWLLVAAVHHRRAPRPVQEVHGCMTVADVFKFVQVEVRFEEGQRPRMHVSSSREFSTRAAARTVLATLRAIVHHRLALHGRGPCRRVATPPPPSPTAATSPAWARTPTPSPGSSCTASRRTAAPETLAGRSSRGSSCRRGSTAGRGSSLSAPCT